jgi:hypothetical protein
MVTMLLTMVYGRPANCVDDQTLSEAKKQIEAEINKLKLTGSLIT